MGVPPPGGMDQTKRYEVIGPRPRGAKALRRYEEVYADYVDAVKKARADARAHGVRVSFGGNQNHLPFVKKKGGKKKAKKRGK